MKNKQSKCIFLLVVVGVNCLAISAESECVDQKSTTKCDEWKNKGWCKGNYVKKKCELTCGLCTPTSPDATTEPTSSDATSEPNSPGEYQPGTPGAEWTEEEVDIVRQKMLKFLTHDKEEIQEMFQGMVPGSGKGEAFSNFGKNRPISEMALFRLSFHDCLTYKDGTGGCDGCLNWDKMGTATPSPFSSQDTYCEHQFEKVNKTDNNGLDRLVFYLEKMYTSIDFPPGAPALAVSLKASGKSRADFWQFATNVALERTIERANFGCRHDFFQRQQVPLLEGVNAGKGFAFGVWKCKIKLNKPFKFQFGRKDCIPSTDTEHPYITEKEENHSNPHGNADEIVADVKNHLGMSAKDLTALTAVHGMIHPFGHGSIGTKYTWFGSSAYLSNMYYKMLANRPTYDVRGSVGFDMKSGNAAGHNLLPYSVGNADGEPVAMWSYRVSCSDCWNTTQSWAGGPCTWRASQTSAPDIHDTLGDSVRQGCFGGYDENGKRTIRTDGYEKRCKDVTYTAEGIQVGDPGKMWKDNGATGGWSNMFMLNYEGGLYKKFDIDPEAFRATGCEGINLQNPGEMWTDGWSGANSVVTSRVNQCPKQDLKVEDGQELSNIVEEFADDHDVWASAFLEAWPRMQSIGYTDLKDGPENSWLGYYSLKDMDAEIGNDFAKYIEDNKPLVFTKESADPYVCASGPSRCATRASEVYEIAGYPMEANGPSCDNVNDCNDSTFGEL